MSYRWSKWDEREEKISSWSKWVMKEWDGESTEKEENRSTKFRSAAKRKNKKKGGVTWRPDSVVTSPPNEFALFFFVSLIRPATISLFTNQTSFTSVVRNFQIDPYKKYVALVTRVQYFGFIRCRSVLFFLYKLGLIY
jgi:hypothetical protein